MSQPDVRDFIYAVSEYDTYGAALTGIGLVPLVGDAEKVGADVATYTWKYPDAIKPLGRHLAAQGIIGLFPADKQLRIIDDFFPVGEDGVKVGTRLKTDYDLDVDDLVTMMSRGVDLSEVVFIVKRADGSIAWLEEGFQEGVRGYGWIHIKKKHITGEVPDGSLFPNTMTEDAVRSLIFDSVKHGTPGDTWGGRIAYVYPIGDGRNMMTIKSELGGIITSYPVVLRS